jgi:hypothetical protein
MHDPPPWRSGDDGPGARELFQSQRAEWLFRIFHDFDAIHTPQSRNKNERQDDPALRGGSNPGRGGAHPPCPRTLFRQGGQKKHMKTLWFAAVGFCPVLWAELAVAAAVKVEGGPVEGIVGRRGGYQAGLNRW